MADYEQWVSTKQAAELIGIGAERIRQLAKDGLLARGPKAGLFDRDAVYLARIAQLQKQIEAERYRAGDRVREVRAREIELRIAERQRELIAFDEAVMIGEQIVGGFRTEYSSLAARVTRDLTLRRRIQVEVDAALARVAAGFDRWRNAQGPSEPRASRRARQS